MVFLSEKGEDYLIDATNGCVVPKSRLFYDAIVFQPDRGARQSPSPGFPRGHLQTYSYYKVKNKDEEEKNRIVHEANINKKAIVFLSKSNMKKYLTQYMVDQFSWSGASCPDADINLVAAKPKSKPEKVLDIISRVEVRSFEDDGLPACEVARLIGSYSDAQVRHVLMMVMGSWKWKQDGPVRSLQFVLTTGVKFLMEGQPEDDLCNGEELRSILDKITMAQSTLELKFRLVPMVWSLVRMLELNGICVLADVNGTIVRLIIRK